MKAIAVSGATGFIGSVLCKTLRAQGYEVYSLVRRAPANAHEIFYDTKKQIIDEDKLAHCDAVINLAGKNLMAQVWTSSFKKELRDSRIDTTSLIAKTLAELKSGPKVLLSTSAIGFYGDTAEQEIDESALPGKGFLSQLCKDWEKACLPAKNAGIRVVNLRFGLVLGQRGGIYHALRPVFKLGLGPIFGSGKQYAPVVSLDDLIEAIIFILNDEGIKGPINIVSPTPATNKSFANAIANVLKRPRFIFVPTVMLQLLGEQAGMLLDSCRAVPRVLLERGFNFSYTNVREIIEHIEMG